MRSQLCLVSDSLGGIRTSIHCPRSFPPFKLNLRWPRARPRWGSPSGDQVPWSHRDHFAGSVLTRRNGALEPGVLQRMILDLDRQALVARIEARTLRHRPALQHAIEFEAEVVVQAARRMALHDEAAGRWLCAGGADCAAPLGSDVRAKSRLSR